LALSAVAVILGTAFVAGSFMFTDTLRATFDDIFTETSADVTVSPKEAFDGADSGAGARTLPPSLVEQVRAVPGVSEAYGDLWVEGVRMLDAEGEAIGSAGPPGAGVIWYTAEGSSAKLVEGRAPQGAGEVVVDEYAADKGDLKVGDRIGLVLPQGPQREMTVVGVASYSSNGSLGGATVAAFDDATAKELLLGKDAYSAVAVYHGDDVSDEQLRDRVADAIGSDYVVRTREEQAEETASGIEEALGFLNYLLLAFAGVALFVGSFIIFNTFSMIVAQRTRELAMLRAIGASRGQVTRSVLLEAAVVGLVGSVLGLAVGAGIASLLAALFGAIGLEIGGGLVLAPRTVVTAIVLGVVVTLVASLVPARRAARVAPVAALRDGVAIGSTSLRVRSIIGGLLTVAGVLALVSGALSDDAGNAASLVGLGALVTLVGMIALAPVVSGPLLRVLGAPAARRGAVGRLSVENTRRNPRRTAATASALMIGLTLVTSFGVLASSANASIDRLVDRGLRADFIAYQSTDGAFSPEVAAAMGQVEGVERVVRERYSNAQIDGETSFVSALDPEAFTESLRATVLSGSADALSRGEVIATQPAAEKASVGVGDSVELLLPSGRSTTLRVGAVLEDAEFLSQWSIPIATWEQLGGTGSDSFLYVTLASGASVDEVGPRLEAATAAYPNLNVFDREEFKDENREQINLLLYMIYALLALALVIAVLGIVNTLALSVTERTREIGLLRAVGMSRRQLRRMVRTESVIIAVLGSVLGIVLGLAFGTSLQQALADDGITQLAVPVVSLLVFLVAAAGVGVLAALWPARRAARMDVLQAVTAE
ncbi:ABC transporter permease, partial [Motilibacter deserti]